MPAVRRTGPWTESQVWDFIAEQRIPIRLAANTATGFPVGAQAAATPFPATAFPAMAYPAAPAFAPYPPFGPMPYGPVMMPYGMTAMPPVYPAPVATSHPAAQQGVAWQTSAPAETPAADMQKSSGPVHAGSRSRGRVETIRDDLRDVKTAIYDLADRRARRRG